MLTPLSPLHSVRTHIPLTLFLAIPRGIFIENGYFLALFMLQTLIIFLKCFFQPTAVHNHIKKMYIYIYQKFLI